MSDITIRVNIPKAPEAQLSTEAMKRISDLAEFNPDAAKVLEALVRHHELLNPVTGRIGKNIQNGFGMSAGLLYYNTDPLRFIDDLKKKNIMSSDADILLIHRGANDGNEGITENSIARTFDAISISDFARIALENTEKALFSRDVK